jgi:hypothetical protein
VPARFSGTVNFIPSLERVMYQIVYFSSATTPYTKEDLLAILRVSRANNERDGVTGMLLYKDGNIMQVLEGDCEQVERRFQVISCDARHRGMIVIERSEIPQRQFGDWSMGFRDLADPELKTVSGFSEYFNKSLALEDFANDASATRELLQFFAASGV